MKRRRKRKFEYPCRKFSASL